MANIRPKNVAIPKHYCKLALSLNLQEAQFPFCTFVIHSHGSTSFLSKNGRRISDNNEVLDRFSGLLLLQLVLRGVALFRCSSLMALGCILKDMTSFGMKINLCPRTAPKGHITCKLYDSVMLLDSLIWILSTRTKKLKKRVCGS